MKIALIFGLSISKDVNNGSEFKLRHYPILSCSEKPKHWGKRKPQPIKEGVLVGGFRFTIISGPSATLGACAVLPTDECCWLIACFSRDHGIADAAGLMLDDVALQNRGNHLRHNLKSCLVALGWDFLLNGALGGRTNMLNIPTSCTLSHN